MCRGVVGSTGRYCVSVWLTSSCFPSSSGCKDYDKVSVQPCKKSHVRRIIKQSIKLYVLDKILYYHVHKVQKKKPLLIT